jgi:hypothetical protein
LGKERDLPGKMFHILLDNIEPQQMIEAFRTMMETLLPTWWVSRYVSSMIPGQIRVSQLYWEMRKIAMNMPI